MQDAVVEREPIAGTPEQYEAARRAYLALPWSHRAANDDPSQWIEGYVAAMTGWSAQN